MPLQIPDDIGGEKRQLHPAVQGVSQFQQASVADVPNAPTDNSAWQLGRALSQLGGTGIQAVQYTKQVYDERDTSEGEVAGQKLAQQKNIKDINQAVAEGKLPAGASPTFLFATKANFLRMRGEQMQMDMRKAYYNSPVRNSDDPDAYTKWYADYYDKNLQGVLNDKDGNPLYSSLEVSKSKILERVMDGGRAVEQEHLAHRISEREKLAYQEAGALLGTVLESDLNTGKNLEVYDAPKYQKVADRLWDVFNNPDTGYVSVGGLDKSKASQLLQDTIVAKAAAEKNVDVLKLGDHIITPGGQLSKTSSFKEKVQLTREHIAGQEDRELRMKILMADTVLYGKSLDESLEIRKQNHTILQDEKNRAKLVYTYKAAMNDIPFKPDAQQSAKLNAYIDDMKGRGLATEAVEYLQDRERASTLLTAKGTQREQDLAVSRIYEAIKFNPTDTVGNTRMVSKALRNELISGENYRYLVGQVHETEQTDPKTRRLLDSPGVKRLESRVENSAIKDPNHPLGDEQIYAAHAGHDFRTMARGFLKANPNAGEFELEDYMAKASRAIAEKYNDTLKDTRMQREETDKKNQETIKMSLQLQKAEEETRIIKSLDRAGTPVNANTKNEEYHKRRGLPAPDYDATTFDTRLGPKNEASFQEWKKKYAHPQDTGADYDLRGAFKAGVKPDAKGHFPDTFKKPNHPTFSNESRYARFGTPGHWEGDKFIPAQ